MRTRTTTLTTAALLLALSACSSSDDSTDAAPPATSSSASSPAPETSASPSDDTAALEDAVKDYTAALFSGDASGHDLMSARCQKQMPKAEWVAMAKDAHQQYGAQKATDVKVDQMSGDLARVSYGAGNIPQFDREGQPWVREGGTWRWDACPSSAS